MLMKTKLSPDEKAWRKRLVSRIKDWETVLEKEQNPTMRLIAKDALANLKKLLEKVDNTP